MAKFTFLDLDGAWGDPAHDLSPVDPALRPASTFTSSEWGRRLRYVARHHDINAFYRQLDGQLSDFILYGSGDFHHLAGMLIRRMVDTPFTLVSFDNHPDWDIKPPYWSCGGWAARTLYTGRVEKVSVWGCGNFELQWPSRISADWRMLRRGKLEVHAWAETQSAEVRRKFDCMTRENWRERFVTFANGIKNQNVYVTVDLDCLRADEAVTNWENGLFTADDVAWAIGELRKCSRFVGGDLCGAYSSAAYERWGQKFAGNWDHPKISVPNAYDALKVNLRSLKTIWPVLAGVS